MRTKQHRLFAILAALCLALWAAPVIASAAGETRYLNDSSKDALRQLVNQMPQGGYCHSPVQWQRPG